MSNPQSRSEDTMVDDVLTRFFRSEMPKPWPKIDLDKLEAAAETPPPILRANWAWIGDVRRQIAQRWQLAAAAAILFLGYATLSTAFPDQRPGGLSIGDQGTIGSRPEVPDWKSGVESFKGGKIKISPLEIDPGKPPTYRFRIEDITPGKR